jgi:hypothetical protein
MGFGAVERRLLARDEVDHDRRCDPDHDSASETRDRVPVTNIMGMLREPLSGHLETIEAAELPVSFLKSVADHV